MNLDMSLNDIIIQSFEKAMQSFKQKISFELILKEKLQQLNTVPNRAA